MERHEIEILLTLAEELHFGRTAERLHVSGARVSQTVKKIERRIGAPLFDRTSRRVELTALGQQLCAEMKPHHDGLNLAVERAISATRGIHGVLRAGFLGIQLGHAAHKAAHLFRDRHPHCRVELTEVQLGDYVTPLRTGELDVLLTLVPIDEPDIVLGPTVLDSQPYAALAVTDPLAGRTSICLDDLDGYAFPSLCRQLPRQWTDRYMPTTTPGGGSIHRTEERCSTFQEVLALVAAGTAVGVGDEQLTRYYLRPDIAYIPITGLQNVRHSLVWRTADDNSRTRAFADIIDELGPDYGPSSRAKRR